MLGQTRGFVSGKKKVVGVVFAGLSSGFPSASLWIEGIVFFLMQPSVGSSWLRL
jgi:hypothetical protein